MRLIKTTMTDLYMNRNQFKVAGRNVRDNIIYTIRKELNDMHFAEPLIKHLSLMKIAALDEYSTVIIILNDYDLTLQFQTSLTNNKVLEYIIDDLGKKPRKEFLSKWNTFYKYFMEQVLLAD